ncbi:MAG: hypothetical protein ACRD9Q_01205 [Nitrososphaeraceae archaeon]
MNEDIRKLGIEIECIGKIIQVHNNHDWNYPITSLKQELEKKAWELMILTVPQYFEDGK